MMGMCVRVLFIYFLFIYFFFFVFFLICLIFFLFLCLKHWFFFFFQLLPYIPSAAADILNRLSVDEKYWKVRYCYYGAIAGTYVGTKLSYNSDPLFPKIEESKPGSKK
jgi:hypothetical protein